MLTICLELEEVEESERLKREKERKHAENVLSLEETKDKISALEKKLAELKTEKHELFQQLKKVLLHEDERKRQTQRVEQK